MNNTRVSTNHCLSAGIAGSREFARVSGYELDLSPARFIDDQHLHCVFYGGVLGTFKRPDGWQIEIQVAGDVALTMTLPDGTEIDYDNRDNSGAVDSDFLDAVDSDQMLNSLNQADCIEWRNNNWIEVNYIDPNGRFIDLSNYGDNVVPDDNVLEVFYHDSAVELFKELDEFIARQNGGQPT